MFARRFTFEVSVCLRDRFVGFDGVVSGFGVEGSVDRHDIVAPGPLVQLAETGHEVAHEHAPKYACASHLAGEGSLGL